METRASETAGRNAIASGALFMIAAAVQFRLGLFDHRDEGGSIANQGGALPSVGPLVAAF